MRLNKYVANATGMSRRQADEAIIAGRVTIDEATAKLGEPVSDEAIVKLDGEQLRPQSHRYVLVDKPIGYVCSRRQQDGKPTIYELLPKEMQSLKVAGRLDADSHGLVILTNDGDLAHQLMHPSHAKSKRYSVKLDRPLAEADLTEVNQGVKLEDGLSRLEVTRLGRALRVSMSEGRNRQIRRTFAALGYTVTDLCRLAIGAYSLEMVGSDTYVVSSKKM